MYALEKISEYVNSIMATNCNKDCERCCKKEVLTEIKRIILENQLEECEG